MFRIYTTLIALLLLGLLTACTTKPQLSEIIDHSSETITYHMEPVLAVMEQEFDGTAEVVVVSNTEPTFSGPEDSNDARIEYVCHKPIELDSDDSEHIRFVRVSVATLWKEPGKARMMDEPSLSVPVNAAIWAQIMTIPEKLWFVGKTETQALYGQAVEVLERQGEWVKVAVKDQYTPSDPAGYPGWMPAVQLTEHADLLAYADCPFLVIKSSKASLYVEPSDEQAFIELSFNTRLPVLGISGDWIQTITPEGGQVWVSSEDVHVYRTTDEIPKPTGSELVETAKQFLDLPYLWAGISSYGFDCSGFTYSLYRHYGIDIPRDSKDQAVQGEIVDPDDLQPGDLLFYAYERGKGRVHHVAMYAGDGMMIHSPRTERSVEVIPITTAGYAEEFAGARRYIH